jgi:hypothetical protein
MVANVVIVADDVMVDDDVSLEIAPIDVSQWSTLTT